MDTFNPCEYGDNLCEEEDCKECGHLLSGIVKRPPRPLDDMVSRDPLLEAVKAAYRKHHMGDDSIGWDELSDILLHALCEAMGDGGYQEWMDSLDG